MTINQSAFLVSDIVCETKTPATSVRAGSICNFIYWATFPRKRAGWGRGHHLLNLILLVKHVRQNCVIPFDYSAVLFWMWKHFQPCDHTFTSLKIIYSTVTSAITPSEIIHSLRLTLIHKDRREIRKFIGHCCNRLWHLQRWRSKKWMNHWPLGLHRIYKAFYMKQFSCPSVDKNSSLGHAWRCDVRNERMWLGNPDQADNWSMQASSWAIKILNILKISVPILYPSPALGHFMAFVTVLND